MPVDVTQAASKLDRSKSSCAHALGSRLWRAGLRLARAGDETGQVVALTAAMLLVLVGFVGLAVDVGSLVDYRRRAQTAADSAAKAGALLLRRGGTEDQITAAARSDSSSNGFTNGTDSVTVTVNHPPDASSVGFEGDANYVQAVVTKTLPTFFMRVLTFNSATVTARAVAGTSSADGCIYTLDPTMSAEFDTSGSGTVNINCGIYVNSSSSTAFHESSGYTINASSISVVGGTSIAGTVNPIPDTGVAAFTDPLADLAPPSFTPNVCDGGTKVKITGGNVTLNPGEYCDGITISGSSGSPAVVHFNPGTYIINGGGFSVSSYSTLTGTGVTFYLTKTAGRSSAQSVSFTNTANITLSAPTSGPMEGILLFEDRSLNISKHVLTADTQNLTGVLYSKLTPIEYKGGSVSSGPYTIIVTSGVKFTGGATLNSDYSSLANGSPIKRTTLAE